MRQRGLFDDEIFDSSRGRRKPQAPPTTPTSKSDTTPASTPEKPKALSVSELTTRIKQLLESRFGEVWVEGEISNFKVYASGHCYFTLKDPNAQMICVIWRSEVVRMKFQPQDGAKVLVRGRLSVYEPRGNYQLVVHRMEPTGVGALAAAFDALKEKLAREGLFDPARKKALPSFPQRIGLVTSLHGAAIRDLLKVILARWPRLELVLAPVRVQGEGAAVEIAQAIADLNYMRSVDVMIVGRGGGSLEDLWAFNEEIVARAIVNSQIPIISAVGHEIDFTIGDFVADVRAATPSHAGELVVPRMHDVYEQLARLKRALPQALMKRLELARERLHALGRSWALRDPRQRIEHARQRLDELQERMVLGMQRRVLLARERLKTFERSASIGLLVQRIAQTRKHLNDLDRRAFGAAQRRVRQERETIAGYAGRLEGLSPLKVLERGYSVTLRAASSEPEEGWKPVRRNEEVKVGDLLMTHLRKGEGRLYSRVERKDPE